jgi:transcription elongation factor S-II
MLYKAFLKGLGQLNIEDDTRLYNLSAAIEDCIYTEHSDTNMKYKNRIRSRVSNIGDLKNPGLKQRLIAGDITPDQIAVMPTEEMASEHMKKLRQTYTDESIRDSQMAVTEGTKSELLKCSKCGKRNCSYNQMQTRSADEPMTTFVLCHECGHRWKFN